MAYSSSNNVRLTGLLAGADLSAKQFYAVKLASTAGEVVVCNATTDHALGVLQNAPADGEPADIMTQGISKMVANSTAVTAGSDVGWSAEGQAASRSAAGSRQFGTALESSSSDGDIISVSLTGYWRR